MGLSDRLGNVEGRILHVASGDLGNADTSYTYINMAAEDYRYLTLFFTITATTLTLEGSNDAMSTANTSAAWTDVTSSLTGAATATSSGGWIVDTPCAIGRLRVKRVTTNATNTLDLYLTRSR